MPRRRPEKSKKLRKVRVRHSNQGRKTVADYVNEAQEALNSLDVEYATSCFHEALLLEPTNTNLMDALADLKMQLGDVGSAAQLLEESTRLAPEVNCIKWMFLAQLSRGEKSAHCFRTGIRLQSALLDGLVSTDLSVENQVNIKELKESILSAYCGIAELYMTDLCYELNAEESCETAIMNALLLDSENLEALQTLASLRISQSRSVDAAAILSPLAARILIAVRRYQARSLRDDLIAIEEYSCDNSAAVPSPEFCIAFTKLLLEVCEQNIEFAEQAQVILEHLLALDDEQPEAWYLLGMAHLSKHRVDQDAAEEVFGQCLALLEQLGKESGGDSEALVNLREAVTTAMNNKRPNLKQYSDNDYLDSGEGTTRSAALLLNQHSTALIVEDAEEEWSTDDDGGGMDTTN